MNAQPNLIQIIARSRLIMLDFDGPICRIFHGYPAPTIARLLRGLVATTHLPLAYELADVDDPLEILRRVGAVDEPQLAQTVASALRDAEVRAVETAEPTPGLPELLSAAASAGRTLAVVSNNSVEAVEAYVNRHGFRSCFASLVGRRIDQDPGLLKPSPHMLAIALAETGIAASSAVLIGDSVTDVNAARAASVSSIAFSPIPEALASLMDAGANAATDSLFEIAHAASTFPPTDLAL